MLPGQCTSVAKVRKGVKNGYEYQQQRCVNASLARSPRGTSEESGRHGAPKRLGVLNVDRQLVLGCGLHRQITGLLDLEDAIDISSRGPELIYAVPSQVHTRCRFRSRADEPPPLPTVTARDRCTPSNEPGLEIPADWRFVARSGHFGVVVGNDL